VADGADGWATGGGLLASLRVDATLAFFPAGLPIASARARRTLSLEAWRGRRAEPRRSNPQERAIEGPAV